MKEERTAQGMSQVELAEKSAYTYQHIWQIENGRNTSWQGMEAIANALGYEMKIVMERSV